MADLMIEDYLDLIDDVFEKAKSVPFSNKNSIVDVEEIRDIMDKIRLNLPSEMKQAKKLVQERKSIIEDANRQAEKIITTAETRAKELVAESEITKAAELRAMETEKQANLKAKEVKNAADKYIVDMLTRAEETLAACHAAVKRTKGTIAAPSPLEAVQAQQAAEKQKAEQAQNEQN